MNAKNALRIAVIGGDGTGPEVAAEGLKVLKAVAALDGFTYETVDFDFGGERYLRTGETLPVGAVDGRSLATAEHPLVATLAEAYRAATCDERHLVRVSSIRRTTTP